MGDPTVGEISFGQRLLLSLPPPPRPPPLPLMIFLVQRSHTMDSGHASHAHVCTCVYIYILCTSAYICMYTQQRQIHAFQRHTRHRPIVDSTADLWVDRSKRGGNDSSFSLSSPFGSRSFLRTKRLAGFSFFFFFFSFLEPLSLSPFPPPDLAL